MLFGRFVLFRERLAELLIEAIVRIRMLEKSRRRRKEILPSNLIQNANAKFAFLILHFQIQWFVRVLISAIIGVQWVIGVKEKITETHG